MASLQKTYQGDLTQSIARRLWALTTSAAQDASDVRNAAEEHIIAQNLKTPDRPFDPQFRRTLKLPFGYEIKGGDYFGQALRHKFTPNPLGFFGSRFQKKPFSDVAQHPFLKGQATPFASPVGPFKPTSSYIMNKLAGQPFPEVAAGVDLKHQIPLTYGNNVKSQTPMVPPRGLTKTSNTAQKEVQVKDPKLGKFFAAVSLSLSASIDSINKRMGDTDEQLITVKEGLFGTIKKLEYSSDILETKLDAIIDALREKNRISRVQAERRLTAKEQEEIRFQKKQYEGEVLQQRDEDDMEFAMRDAADEKEDGTRVDMGGDGQSPDPWTPQLARGGIVEGPQSGYPAILHGREMVIPLDTPATQSYAGGTVKPKTSIVNNFDMMGADKGASFQKFAPTMFRQVIESKTSEMPALKQTTEVLGKAIELPVKASGLVAFNVLGKALSGMNELAGDVSGPLRTVLTPLQAFGLPSTIINSLTKSIEVGGAQVGRRKKTSQFGAEQKNQGMISNFISSISNFFKGGGPGGYGGGGYTKASSKSGGGTKYAGGGPGNFFEGAKNWWNRGRNVRVVNENTTRWFGRDGLLADDWKQRGKVGKGGKLGGWDFTRGFRPGVPANEGGMMSGPTPAIRQSIERPLRAIRSLGAAKGGFIGLVLNELMNPAPLADGTLEGNRDAITNFSNINRNENSDKFNQFVNLESFNQKTSKLDNYVEQQNRVMEINNQQAVVSQPEKPLELIANNPSSDLSDFWSSPYNYS